MNAISVPFDANVFSLKAVKSAAYKYLHVFTAEITIDHEQIHCVLHFSPSYSEDKVQQTVSDFKTEVLDQDLREQLKAETEAVRNLILAHAFSKTGLVDQ